MHDKKRRESLNLVVAIAIIFRSQFEKAEDCPGSCNNNSVASLSFLYDSIASITLALYGV